jgi:hypothetical protein
VDKQLSCHRKILEHLDVVEKNYEIMQLYEPQISGVNKRSIDYIVENFEPEFNKLNFTKLLMEDGQITIKLENLYVTCRKIIS